MLPKLFLNFPEISIIVTHLLFRAKKAFEKKSTLTAEANLFDFLYSEEDKQNNLTVFVLDAKKVFLKLYIIKSFNKKYSIQR